LDSDELRWTEPGDEPELGTLVGIGIEPDHESEDDDDLSPGSHLGRYVILARQGIGGMGVVYEARHRMTKKAVALKVLFPHIGKDTGARQRFLREVSAPAQIGHPGIVEVYDADFDAADGSLFVAMELLVGDTFRDWLGRGGHRAIHPGIAQQQLALAVAHAVA